MTPAEIGTRIRLARREQGLRQVDLALAAGTGLRFISDIECGKPTCQLAPTLRVIEALGLRVELRGANGA
jgi:HTH-type transcriptional regulator / antitoxin HipB